MMSNYGEYDRRREKRWNFDTAFWWVAVLIIIGSLSFLAYEYYRTRPEPSIVTPPVRNEVLVFVIDKLEKEHWTHSSSFMSRDYSLHSELGQTHIDIRVGFSAYANQPTSYNVTLTEIGTSPLKYYIFDFDEHPARQALGDAIYKCDVMVEARNKREASVRELIGKTQGAGK